jgi:tripartite-type tricarboxylate transporter receptor subunit TctC
MKQKKYRYGLSALRSLASRLLSVMPAGTLALAAGWLFVLAVPASVFSQVHLYQGKTLTLILSTAPGGTSDMMVKAALPYLKKHIPGQPSIIAEYMPGGGGVKAVNHLYKNVRPDGFTMGNVGGGLVSNAVLGEPAVLYDIDKLIYLGSAHSHYHWVFMSRREAKLVNLEALRSASGVRVGAQSIGHSVYIVGRLFAYLIGLKEPKFVVGYSGPELDLGLIKGEFDARINNADTLLKRNKEWLSKGMIDVHAIMEVPKGLKHEHFGSLPEVEDFARSERERKVLAMLRAFRQVGSPYILPPGTPREQVNILREALVKTFKDPGFHQDYKKLTGDEATPLMPQDMEKAIRELPRDRETVDFFKKIASGSPLPPR